MKTLWCEVHDSIADMRGNVCHAKSGFHRYDDSTCTLVPMRLIPERFLVATVNMGGIAHWMIPVSALDGGSDD